MAIIIYFGVPGSGKTTHAASIVYKNLKHGFPTFCNVDIEGSIPFSTKDDIGVYNMSDADMIIDEASIEYNNRAYKSLAQSAIQWFKLYRHYGIRNIYVYSQSYGDMDITLRRLADRLFVVRRSLIPRVITTVPIKVKIGIDDNTHQIIDEYYFDKLHIKMIRAKKYWSMFNSWACPPLPSRPFDLAGHGDFVNDPKLLKSVYKDIRRRNRIFYRLFHKRKNTIDKSSRKTRLFVSISKFFKRPRGVIGEAGEGEALPEAASKYYSPGFAAVDQELSKVPFFSRVSRILRKPK